MKRQKGYTLLIERDSEDALGEPQAEELKVQVRFGDHMAKSAGNIFYVWTSQQADEEIFQRCHDLRGILGSDLRAILGRGHIPDAVKAVFDLPESPIKLVQQLRLPGHG
jgi:hypothetical protein